MPARMTRRLTTATAVLALVACLAAPVAYTAQTIGSAHTGSVPSAGPSAAGGAGPGGGFAGAGQALSGNGNAAGPRGGFARGGSPPFANGAGSRAAEGDGAASSALVTALKSGASGYRWAAATSGSQSAASLELATGGVPVMAIGGFNNQGGNITLAQFEAYVKAGDIHYYIASGNGFGGGAGGGFGGRAGGPGGGSSTSAITSWVEAHYRSETISGQTLYDLTRPLQS
jgi:hypothetical protein